MDTLTIAYILLLNPLLCSALLNSALYIVPYIHPLLCSPSDTEQVHQWVLFGGLCPSDLSHRRCEPLRGKEDDVSPIFGHTIGNTFPSIWLSLRLSLILSFSDFSFVIVEVSVHLSVFISTHVLSIWLWDHKKSLSPSPWYYAAAFASQSLISCNL